MQEEAVRTSKGTVLLLAICLIAAPLHAQTMFACDMMDGAPLEDCCCAGIDADVRASLDETTGQRCCAEVVELRADQGSDHAQKIATTSALESEGDPPVAAAASLGYLPSSPNAVIAVPRVAAVPRATDNDIYLITQRLRI